MRVILQFKEFFYMYIQLNLFSSFHAKYILQLQESPEFILIFQIQRIIWKTAFRSLTKHKFYYFLFLFYFLNAALAALL